ncbi:LOW QUALITY PROTEIN: fatty-acyl-CoA synthase, partial [Kutzneria sp. 744]
PTASSPAWRRRSRNGWSGPGWRYGRRRRWRPARRWSGRWRPAPRWCRSTPRSANASLSTSSATARRPRCWPPRASSCPAAWPRCRGWMSTSPYVPTGCRPSRTRRRRRSSSTPPAPPVRPRGVVLPRRAIASNLDSLSAAWEWTAADVVTHALPIFHVHGLVVGVLGPLRRGGSSHHMGKFSAAAAGAKLAGPATMMFGVPTMYSRLAADVEADPGLAKQISQARLLVSGSAPLPASLHERISQATGQRIVERYGMTETLMNCSVRAWGERRPGTVGLPVDRVEVRLVDDAGSVIEVSDDATIGEIEVRGPNLFLEYLNRPEATAEAMHDGWFRTGDMATRAADGYIRIVGRRATDIIKSGGFKIGAGEIENALLEHPGVAEVAVAGRPDDDLGERIVAWVVPAASAPDAQELIDHVARLLTPHKRPRAVNFVDSLPRNELGKVTKRALP